VQWEEIRRNPSHIIIRDVAAAMPVICRHLQATELRLLSETSFSQSRKTPIECKKRESPAGEENCYFVEFEGTLLPGTIKKLLAHLAAATSHRYTARFATMKPTEEFNVGKLFSAQPLAQRRLALSKSTSSLGLEQHVLELNSLKSIEAVEQHRFHLLLES